MSLTPVEEALRRVLGSVAEPVAAETRFARAKCRANACARHRRNRAASRPSPHPPWTATRCAPTTLPRLPATLRVIGTSAAGHRFHGGIGRGEAVRIFTGAPMPEGADAIVIQEDTEAGGEDVLIKEKPRPGRFIRKAALDFAAGETLLKAGERLDARRLALAAAMGHGTLAVRRKPRVAILATGDELVLPGERPGPDQIVASNPFAVAALVERAGGEALDLGIARDTFEALEERILAARDAQAPTSS